MSLDEKFVSVRTMFYEIVGNFFQKIAELFGYPINSGMPSIPNLTNEGSVRSHFLANLPRHKTFWPPIQRPNTVFEMIFGPTPKVDLIPKYIYESKEEGFYNFYLENYKNMYFLPDWLSEILQVNLNICLDLTILETIREVLFIGLMVYSQIVVLRIALAWYIYINPYTFPWCYLVAAVDWTEDVLQGVIPSILGINVTASVFLGILGVLADSLNHLVFTMPFLPSEGEKTKLLINEKMTDVLVFHYLPVLWFRYPVPNELREFWYYQRPDILIYMQEEYKNLRLKFLPDSVFQKLNQDLFEKLTHKEAVATLSSTILLPEMTLPSDDFTDVFSKNHLILKDSFLTNFTVLSETFHSLFGSHLETLL
jgi:hypothetical protein